MSMNDVRKTNRTISILLITLLFLMSYYSSAQAAMVSTQQMVDTNNHQQIQQQLVTTLQRDEIKQQLLELGVQPQQVLLRVESMTDNEVQQLAGLINDTPAGSGIVGILAVVLVGLVITDLLEVTNIFNF